MKKKIVVVALLAIAAMRNNAARGWNIDIDWPKIRAQANRSRNIPPVFGRIEVAARDHEEDPLYTLLVEATFRRKEPDNELMKSYYHQYIEPGLQP